MKRRSDFVGRVLLAGLLIVSAVVSRGQTLINQDSVQSGNLTSGDWAFYTVDIPAGSPGWRMVIQSSGAEVADLYVRKGANPTTGSYDFRQTGLALGTLVVRDDEISDGTWHVGVRMGNTTGGGPHAYELISQTGWVTDLVWDDGSTDAGVSAVSSPTGDAGGRHYFRIVTENPTQGAWRQRLDVTSGEADLFMSTQLSITSGSAQRSSQRIGDDGFVIPLSTTSGAGTTWYLAVDADDLAEWNLVAGDVHVKNLGVLADGSGSGEPVGTVPPEGVRFLRTTIPSEALAWRLWLQNAGGVGTLENEFFARRGEIPVPSTTGSWANPTADREAVGQALFVPPFVNPGQGDLYYVAIAGAPGDTFALDSRQHVVEDLAFGASVPDADATGYRYRSYRTTVPVNAIGWEVSVLPLEGDPSVAARRDFVANARYNDAFSEVESTTVGDSFTMVPSTLSDGTFFMTTYSTDGAGHRGNLTNGEPLVTGVDFASSSVNASGTGRAGWRYFVLTDIGQQLGALGWLLETQSAPAGAEIAIRRNALPSHWQSRTNGGPSNHNDFDDLSHVGVMQRPEHEADIWYVGVYSGGEALGAFTLDSGPLTAPVQSMDGLSLNISDLPPGIWEYFRVDVTSTLGGQTVLGWEVLMKDWVGGTAPDLRIARDILPTDTIFTNPFTETTSWETGREWKDIDGDWTRRSTSADGSQVNEVRMFSMAMGQPLEPGTYYVGLKNKSTSVPCSFTVATRAVGETGSGLGHEVSPLAFNGGVASGTLDPRAVDYYSVDVPAGTGDWRVSLEMPSGHEGRLFIRKAVLPNEGVSASKGSRPWDDDYESGDLSSHRDQTGLANEWREEFICFPDEGETSIPAGRYYLAVVSEGQGANGSRIGDLPVDYTLESHGVASITDLGVLTAGGQLTVNGVFEGGALELYHYTVDAGIPGLELRLRNRAGDPIMFEVAGSAFAGNRASSNNPMYGIYSGVRSDFFDNEILTQSAPAAGVHSVLVGRHSGSSNLTGGSYTLEVRAISPTTLPVNGGSSAVTDLHPQGFVYFRVDVPAAVGAHDVLGWEVVLDNWSGGEPVVAVRRDLLSTQTSASSWVEGGDWPSGASHAEQSDIWTTRRESADGLTNPERVAMFFPMGQPLEPGTYFVGVHNSSDTLNSSFTVHSRLAGPAGSGFAHEAAPVTFSGGVATGTLDPRDLALFTIDIPANTPSWQTSLVLPAGDEAKLYLRKSLLPNPDIRLSWDTLEPWSARYDEGTGAHNIQTELSKPGGEVFTAFPEPEEDFIPAGLYYAMIYSEGRAPSASDRVGASAIDFTFTSHGSAAATDLGEIGPGAPLITSGAYPEGEPALYRFTLPEGVTALDLRLSDRVGEPEMFLRNDGNWGLYSLSYGVYSSYGALNTEWQSDQNITIPSPAAGEYLLAIADRSSGSYVQAGSFTLTVEVLGLISLAVDGAEASVAALGADSWIYYEVQVPADIGGDAILGWEVALENWSGGNPALFVRRDLPPPGGGAIFVSDNLDWPSGYHMSEYASDWTLRGQSADGSQYGERLAISMPMGQPLQPGTYVVGVNNQSTTEPCAFTLTSRSIGESGSGFSYELSSFAYNGGTVAGTLPARDVKYYSVDVPANTESWSLSLEMPPGHEGCMYIRKSFLPGTHAWARFNDSPWDPSFETGASSHGVCTMLRKNGSEYWTCFPDTSETYLPEGRYYIMVVSEGRNPLGSNQIGTGSIDFVLTSHGAADVTDLGAVDAGGSLTQLTGEALEAGEIGFYQFSVPGSLDALEIRLDDRVGESMMYLNRFDRFGTAIPFIGGLGYGMHGGSAEVRDERIFTFAQPPGGTYSLVVGHAYGAGSLTDLGYTVTISSPQPQVLNADGGTAGGTLGEDQRHYYQVEIPAMLGMEDVLGWRLQSVDSSGRSEIRVRKGSLPGDSVVDLEQTPFVENTALTVPPVLSPGTWFVELRGINAAAYTLNSELIVLSSLEREVWNMPDEGQASTTPGMSGASFADTAIDAIGDPVPGTGVDLGNGEFHLYAFDVPEGNGGLMQVTLESISGNPDVYIREDALPTLSHDSNGTVIWGDDLYTRYLDATTMTQYGNFVPISASQQGKLRAGRWFVMVRAGGATNSRYRLRLAHSALPRVKSLAMDGGSHSGQSLVEGDWLYYQVELPSSVADTPESWSITFSQTQGDVDLFFRSGAPPGDRNTPSSPGSSNPFVADWRSDALDPGAYGSVATAGTTVISGTDLEPGQTYYLGFRARTDSTFNVFSAVSANTIEDSNQYGTIADLSGEGGTADIVLAPGERRTWRVTFPPEADRWYHRSTHTSSVNVRLRRSFLPNLNSTAGNLFTSSTHTDTARSFAVTPVPPHYLTVVNTGATPEPFSVLVDWREFTMDLSATGGGQVSRTPSIALYNPGEPVTLTATPDANHEFVGWNGVPGGDQTPLVIEMDSDKVIIGEFRLNHYDLNLTAPGGTLALVPDLSEYPHGSEVVVTVNPGTGLEFLGWNGGIDSIANPLTLTMLMDVSGEALIGTSLGAALGEPELSLRTSGALAWFLQSDVTRPGGGVEALRSGAIGHNEQSYVETTVTGPGTIGFWWKSDGQLPDGVRFLIDGNVADSIGGVADWAMAEHGVVAGEHTLRWEFWKNISGTTGLDSGFLDSLNWVSDDAYSEWVTRVGLQPGSDGPNDRNGPFNLENLMLFSLGLDPTETNAGRLPGIHSVDGPNGGVVLRHTRAKSLGDVVLKWRISTSLVGWADALVLGETVVDDSDPFFEVVDVEVETESAGESYFHLQAESP